MPLRRIGAALAATALVALSTAAPAAAHGAPTKPISRTAACAGDGTETGSAACRAATKANGRAFGKFDNLRVNGVNGRDREVIPDGELCSGGVDAYRGLDLVRDDWPSTKFTAGDTMTIRYTSPIPHQGTFRFYLTKASYDPGKALSWDDLPAKAFREIKDPPLVDGAYRMSAKLPKDRTGRHVLYTIWQNSSTADTYYSCSDLVLAAPPAPKKSAVAVPRKSPAVSKAPKRAAPVATTAAPVETPSSQQLRRAAGETRDDRTMLYLAIGLLALGGVTGAYAIARIRRGRRAQESPREHEIR